MNDVLGQQGQAADLHAFGMQVMLGKADAGETQVFHHARNLGDFIEHFLPTLGMVGNGSQGFAFLGRGGNGRQTEIHELHTMSPF